MLNGVSEDVLNRSLKKTLIGKNTHIVRYLEANFYPPVFRNLEPG
jgi:hypothetical protein